MSIIRDIAKKRTVPEYRGVRLTREILTTFLKHKNNDGEVVDKVGLATLKLFETPDQQKVITEMYVVEFQINARIHGHRRLMLVGYSISF
jgi:hypothetical protein